MKAFLFPFWLLVARLSVINALVPCTLYSFTLLFLLCRKLNNKALVGVTSIFAYKLRDSHQESVRMNECPVQRSNGCSRCLLLYQDPRWVAWEPSIRASALTQPPIFISLFHPDEVPLSRLWSDGGKHIYCPSDWHTTYYRAEYISSPLIWPCCAVLQKPGEIYI